MAVTAMVDKTTGDIITEAEWDKIKAYLDAAFPLVGANLDAAWTTWAPTYANLTVGNGVTTARYARVGRWVAFELKFVMGSTSAMGTNPTFTLPVTAASRYTLNMEHYGTISIFDTSVPAIYAGISFTSTTGIGLLGVYNASGTYTTITGFTSAIPMTWAVGDAFSVKGWYEAAA